MSTEFIAGTSGRVKTVKVTRSTTSDMPPGFNGVAFTPAARAAVAEVTSWNVTDNVNTEPILTFESPTNGEGVVYPLNLAGGTSSGVKVELSGVYNAGTGTPTHAEFPVGSYVVVDLIYHKGNNFGYGAYLCKVTNYKSGGKAGPAAFDFSCTLDGVGPLPTPAVLT